MPLVKLFLSGTLSDIADAIQALSQSTVQAAVDSVASTKLDLNITINVNTYNEFSTLKGALQSYKATHPGANLKRAYNEEG